LRHPDAIQLGGANKLGCLSILPPFGLGDPIGLAPKHVRANAHFGKIVLTA
jgi:hypothetical protein